jgi:hypothetical protein
MFKCEICGKISAVDTVCCGVGMKNYAPRDDVFSPEMGR